MGKCQSKEGNGRKDEYAIPTPEFHPTQPTPRSSSATPPPQPTTTLPTTPASPLHLDKPYVPPNSHLPPKKQTPQEEPTTVPSKKYSYQVQQQQQQQPGRATRPGAVAVTGNTPNYQPQQQKRPSNPREKVKHKSNQQVPVIRESKEDYKKYFQQGKTLGSGAFATVFVGTKYSSGKDYAIKCVDRTKMNWSGRDALQDEIASLKQCRGGPNIVQLYEVFTPNTRQCYLVMELLQGGELFECILKKRTFTEKEARKVIRGLLSALDFMHSKRIAHRDLKPENLLLVVSIILELWRDLMYFIDVLIPFTSPFRRPPLATEQGK